MCRVIVLLPNNHPVQISCKPDATVRTIYETVITYVDLIEQNLFGLTILAGTDIEDLLFSRKENSLIFFSVMVR